MPGPEPTLAYWMVAAWYAFFHRLTSGATSVEPPAVIVAAIAPAVIPAAPTHKAAAETPVILFRCKREFLSDGLEVARPRPPSGNALDRRATSKHASAPV